jgi:hypothetical protein
MENRPDDPRGGDDQVPPAEHVGSFAEGEETRPHDEHAGSFAEGEETRPHDEHAGSFAEGEESLPRDEHVGSFADTDEENDCAPGRVDAVDQRAARTTASTATRSCARLCTRSLRS